MGGWKYLILLFFYALMAATLGLVIVNWREDAAQREFVNDVTPPNFDLINPILYLDELGFATALILGLFVRLAGGRAFTLNLWLGIYKKCPGDPDE